jgi:hypothetical protein
VVTMLRPLQFGWHVTDVQGRATIRFGSLPADGTLVGMVEHATERLGALFAFKRDETGTARVQLFPVGAVKGRIVTEKGKPVEGAAVAGLFGEDGLTLWRTVSRGDGTFEWPDVIPQVPQQVIAYLDEKASSQAAAFTVEISGSKDLGDIVVADGMPRKSLYGKPLAWHENRLLAGTMPERKERKDRPAVVMYCSATDAPMVVEGITAASSLVPDRNIVFAVVVDGPFTSESATIPVLSGKAPGPATTYLIGPDGVVRLETFGLPPVRALQRDEG